MTYDYKNNQHISMIRSIATRRMGRVVGAAMLSTTATATYIVSCQEGQKQPSAELPPMTTTVSLDTAQRLLNETTLQLQTSTSNTIHEAHLRTIVLARFLDLLSRSAYAIMDYKLAKWTDADLSNVHERTARSIYEACATHGGVLVKVGQYLAVSAGGFIPQVYIEALSPLQDEVSPLPLEQIEEVLEQELRVLYGDSLDTTHEPLWKRVFSEIEPVPLGSASLAQVHQATLRKDGRQVALKIQRPNLDKTVRADMLALSILSKAVERAFPGSGFDWMLPEFHKTIVAELDFTQEALNSERCNRMVGGSRLSIGTSFSSLFRSNESLPKVIIPKPISELTTSRLLTMSFEEGFRMTDKQKLEQHGIDPRQVAASACSLFSELMMVHGFVHADAHPGNALVRPRMDADNNSTGEFDIVLLDHGMYRRLDESFRSNYCKLWAGLVTGDDARALEGVRGLGLPDEYLDLMGLMLTYRVPAGLGYYKLGSFSMDKSKRKELRAHLEEKFGADIFTPSSMNDFMESQARDLLFCLRCTNLVRGMNRDLGGTTRDRFIAFGAAAARGDKLSSNIDLSSTGVASISKEEASLLTQSDSDILASVKESLNQPVVSELHAIEKRRQSNASGTDVGVLLPRTMADNMESLNILLRTWLKGVLVDLLLMLRGGYVETSSRRLG